MKPAKTSAKIACAWNLIRSSVEPHTIARQTGAERELEEPLGLDQGVGQAHDPERLLRIAVRAQEEALRADDVAVAEREREAAGVVDHRRDGHRDQRLRHQRADVLHARHARLEAEQAGEHEQHEHGRDHDPERVERHGLAQHAVVGGVERVGQGRGRQRQQRRARACRHGQGPSCHVLPPPRQSGRPIACPRDPWRSYRPPVGTAGRTSVRAVERPLPRAKSVRTCALYSLVAFGAARGRRASREGSGGRTGRQSPPARSNTERDHEGTTVGQADV